jgi:hypothetical protein
MGDLWPHHNDEQEELVQLRQGVLQQRQLRHLMKTPASSQVSKVLEPSVYLAGENPHRVLRLPLSSIQSFQAEITYALSEHQRPI